jgi:hypothetical protein
MGIGEWGVGNGEWEWGMGNGDWGIGNREVFFLFIRHRVKIGSMAG